MQKRVEELQEELRQFPHIMRGGGRFDPKLNFQERCEILALYISGTNRRVLAAAYGLDRRTVAHIYNERSMHYKAVRAELFALGKEEFLNRYLTESAVERTKQVANDPRVTLADTEERETSVKDSKPASRRNRDAGFHVVKPDHCAYSHRINIAWRDSSADGDGVILPEGWWYKDLDGAFPDDWFYGDEVSLTSSTNTLRWCEENIVDPV
jgi:hypothetical protein